MGAGAVRPRDYRLALFGAFARGEGALPDTDVDVLAAIDELDRDELVELVQRGAEIATAYALAFTPLAMTGVAEELSLGDAALRAAEALAGFALNHDALSRLYFAAFHWARALLASAGIEARTHQGAQPLVGMHFVRTGRLQPEFQHTLSRLETWRTKADYTRGFVADDALVARELGEARALRARLMELIDAAPQRS